MSVLPTELHDFRNFLFLAWEYLNLPPPTDIQYDIADYLQAGPRRRVIKAFRGVGKSWITSAYVCWRLGMDPQVNIFVVSASKQRADDFTTFTRQLIDLMPELHALKPQDGQRDSKISFDVGPALPDHAPSVKSAGITGQLSGSRADEIIADDIEVPNNSATPDMRDKLAELIKEFDAILKPNGIITYLGTPQTEETIYSRLQERGYETRIWPARYPDKRMQDIYGDRLAPRIATAVEKTQRLIGKTTDPKRFSDTDLLERELSYGRSGFALQFMLDTSLSDANKYPLKLNDLVVMSGVSTWTQAPISYQWASGPDQRKLVEHLASVGLRGDYYVGPMRVSETFQPFQGSLMYIDPSGKGGDELAYAVVKLLAGNLYLTCWGGLQGGYTDQNLIRLCEIARTQRVNHCQIEANFGDGMFTQLLKPHMNRIYPLHLEDVKVGGMQKELRIISNLEPVLNQHRLVVAMEGIKAELADDRDYQLMYQISRITKDRGALRHDDRIDAVAGAVSYWTKYLQVDQTRAEEDHREALLQKDLDAFMETAIGRKPRPVVWASVK
jgi:hypothetical protein